jgi:hypothetical protein
VKTEERRGFSSTRGTSGTSGTLGGHTNEKDKPTETRLTFFIMHEREDRFPDLHSVLFFIHVA